MQVYSINSFRGLPLYFSGKHEASDKVSKKEQKNYKKFKKITKSYWQQKK